MRDDYGDCGCGSCCLPTIVQERDDALLEADRRAADAQREIDAAEHEARRCQDDNEWLRVSLAIALELLGEVSRRRVLDGSETSIAVNKFLSSMRAGR